MRRAFAVLAAEDQSPCSIQEFELWREMEYVRGELCRF